MVAETRYDNADVSVYVIVEDDDEADSIESYDGSIR